ncbi:MAG TPA: diguanylate cyclase [Gaiellaceae bacterium]|jgi:diguanylate cyclase (GGDEF)-like protein/putative nucleotidyltransferase with HDIG domain|nr:diguanylate cyclase [Gaiellaceae bacterium]
MPRRLTALIFAVCTAGGVVLVAAAWEFASAAHSGDQLVGMAALTAAATLAERFPVPISPEGGGVLSLTFVFAVAAIVLYGWAAGALLLLAATAIVQSLQHRPWERIAYNVSVLALVALSAGALISPIHGDSAGATVARVVIAATADNVVNVVLISAAMALSSEQRYLPLLRTNTRNTIVPFAFMGSAALMLVVLWQRSPGLSLALVGPLLAISLYQRSTHRALRAMRLALTDPLTGLGNHRHFHERLQRELQTAEEAATPLTLCFVDVDDFKRINDRFGHPSGDRVLSQVAGRLRQGGEAFRLGGDEFALLLVDHDENDAVAAASSIVERIRALDLDHIGRVTVSAGLATFPMQGHGRDELIRLADSALYWAKEHGKNRVRLYRPDVVELAELKRLAAGPDRAARYRAAASLAKAVDARDTYTGSHSGRVADLAARLAARIGLDAEQVELTRLAGSLHDLGKLAIPEELLRKAGELTDSERLVLERHPQIGYRMLDSLGVDPVADIVLHHHERWDGAGYPDGLRGEEIPFGARIIFVADAYDAMTSDRVYRARRSHEEALAELRRCCGTQFDPLIVDAFAEELEALSDEPPVLVAL